MRQAESKIMSLKLPGVWHLDSDDDDDLGQMYKNGIM